MVYIQNHWTPPTVIIREYITWFNISDVLYSDQHVFNSSYVQATSLVCDGNKARNRLCLPL